MKHMTRAGRIRSGSTPVDFSVAHALAGRGCPPPAGAQVKVTAVAYPDSAMYVNFSSAFGVLVPAGAGWPACAGRGAGAGPVVAAGAGVPIAMAAPAAANPVIVRIMMGSSGSPSVRIRFTPPKVHST